MLYVVLIVVFSAKCANASGRDKCSWAAAEADGDWHHAESRSGQGQSQGESPESASWVEPHPPGWLPQTWHSENVSPMLKIFQRYHHIEPN